MAFDPNGDVQLLDAPAPAAAGPKAFDPTAPVDPDTSVKPFDPDAAVDPEHPYVTKIRSDPTLSDEEKESRVDAFNEGLAKFDPSKPVTVVQRFTIHAKEAIGETLPALAVKAASDFGDQPFQAVPLPLRLAQGQLDDLQREKDRRTGKLGDDAMADPTLSEYPDTVLESEITKAQGRVQKFMTPENVAAMRAEATRIADVQAKAAGEKESYANLPAATGPLQKGAAVAGEIAGGLTDPTNFLPLGEVDKSASLARRLLTTGKNLAGQVATTEPVRQTLAEGANEPEQTGALPAAQRVAGGFVGGIVLQGGSEALGKVVSMFKGVKAADVAGKTADEAAPIIAEKTGQDPATVQAQLKTILPAAPEVAAAHEQPATSTLSLNPEDKPDAAPEVTSKFDPENDIEPEAPVRAGKNIEPQEDDKYQYTVQRPQPHPLAPEETIPGYTQVDVIRNGDSAGSSNPAALRAMGHDVPDVPDHLPQGQYSRDEVQDAIDNPPAAAAPESAPKVPVEAPNPPPPQAPAAQGLISGSPLETWADQVVKNWKSGTQVSMTGGMDLFAARAVQGAAVLERGITDFGKWSAEMIRKYGEDLRPHLENLYRVAKELHGEGDRVGNATPDDVKDFVADYRNADHQKLIEDAGKETTPATRTESAMSSLLNEKAPEIKGLLKKLAGESAPRTSALAEESGNALVRYASAAQAGPEIARAHAGIVLGEHIHDPEFANKLGGALVQDRLNGIKAGLLKQAGEAAVAGDRAGAQEFFEHAQNVTSIIGKEDSPFKTPADYEAALKDPEVAAAIQRHKETVQPIALRQHTELGGRVAQSGVDTGAFVNLEPLDKEGESISGPAGRGTRKGDLTAPFKKGTAFGKQAYGTADNYVTDYNEIARRMITGNFEETAKRQLYDQLSKDGLGVILPPGERPPDINGLAPRKIQIERRGLPSASGARTMIRNMYVDPRIYPEVIRAMNVDETFKGSALSHLSNVLNWLQLKGPVNAAFHIANVLSSIAGSQGGKSVVADLVRKLPGVNIVDALGKIALRARDVVADSAEVRQEIGKLARIGAGRAPWEGAGATGRLVQLVDKAARLVRSDMYDNMIARGWAKDSEAGRREFVNQIGQYNPRLMGQISAKLKEWGTSPFIVAGQSFNRQALRRVTGSPGITPASTMASVGMRAAELGSMIATLFAVPMSINYALNGNAMGRPGTPLGAIDTGKTADDGKAVIVDPQQWTGMRRGLRLTGANAVASGIMKGESSANIKDSAAKDIAGSFLHPYAGPLVNAGVTLGSGYNASFYRQATKAKAGESQAGQNAVAAIKQLNPMVGNSLQGTNEQKEGSGTLQDLKNGRIGEAAADALKGAAKPFLDAVGVKEAAVASPEQQVRTRAAQFAENAGLPRRDSGGQPSEYSGLTTAVQVNDLNKARDEMEDLVRTKAAQVQGNLTEATKLAIAKREIADYYAKEARAPFTGSLQNERAFKATLDSDGQTLYSQARNDRRENMQTVRSLLYGR